MSIPEHTPGGRKRLARNTDRAMIGGVCAGIADYTGMDVNLIRLLTVVGVIVGFGSVAVAYVAAWILMPAR